MLRSIVKQADYRNYLRQQNSLLLPAQAVCQHSADCGLQAQAGVILSSLYQEFENCVLNSKTGSMEASARKDPYRLSPEVRYIDGSKRVDIFLGAASQSRIGIKVLVAAGKDRLNSEIERAQQNSKSLTSYTWVVNFRTEGDASNSQLSLPTTSCGSQVCSDLSSMNSFSELLSRFLALIFFVISVQAVSAFVSHMWN